MATINEDYVSFEIAKLLKEKGFDAEIDTYYSPKGEFKIWCPNGIKSYLDNKGTETWWWKCIAPTLQMVMKWLREVHNTIIIIIPSVLQSDNLKWIASIRTFNKEKYYLEEQGIVGKYNTYEEAAENAIKYCLENLI